MIQHSSRSWRAIFGTIRGDYAASRQRNVVHSSDSVETAEAEVSRFFEAGELLDYDKDEWKHIYSQADHA